VRWHTDTLHIGLFRPGKRLLLLGNVITDATLATYLYNTQRQPPRHFATAVTVQKTGGAPPQLAKAPKHSKKHKTHKTKFISAARIEVPRAVRKYGYLHRVVIAPHISNAAEASRAGRRYLGHVLDPERTLTVEHPGIPGIRRGDAVMVNTPQGGSTKKQVCFVEVARHTIASGGYTGSTDLTFDDPFTDNKQLHIWDIVDYVAKQRGRKQPHKGTGAGSGKPTKAAKRAVGKKPKRRHHKPDIGKSLKRRGQHPGHN
jgi:hypothetical protein